MKLLASKNLFPLENGEVLPEITIAYHTYGILNERKNNVVWVFHALTANSDAEDWWSGLVGEGRMIDPSQYFIVCANMLGSHYGSTSPLSINPKTGKPYGTHFPLITIRDVVKAHQILAKHLNIEKIYLGLGGSMGGQQVLEWAISEPERFENIAAIACGARMSAWGIALNEAQRMAVEASLPSEAILSSLNQADLIKTLAETRGIEAARAIGMLSYRNYVSFNIRQSETSDDKMTNFTVSSYQRYQGEKLRHRFNPLSYISISRTMDSHNVGRNRGGAEKALRKIKANTLIVGIQSDILFPKEEQAFLAAHIPASKFVLIDSPYGHDGFLIEFEQLLYLLRQFLGKTNLRPTIIGAY